MPVIDTFETLLPGNLTQEFETFLARAPEKVTSTQIDEVPPVEKTHPLLEIKKRDISREKMPPPKPPQRCFDGQSKPSVNNGKIAEAKKIKPESSNQGYHF